MYVCIHSRDSILKFFQGVTIDIEHEILYKLIMVFLFSVVKNCHSVSIPWNLATFSMKFSSFRKTRRMPMQWQLSGRSIYFPAGYPKHKIAIHFNSKSNAMNGASCSNQKLSGDTNLPRKTVITQIQFRKQIQKNAFCIQRR